MKDLSSHKKGPLLIKNKRKILKLTKEHDVNEQNIFDHAIYDNDYFGDRYWKFINYNNEKNGRRLTRDSAAYKKLRITIMNTYLKVALTLIMDTLLRGERIVFFKHIMSLYLTSLPTFKMLSGKLKYKYIHAFQGTYPVIRPAIGERVIYAVSILRRIHNKAMRIDAFYYPTMSQMISHKLINENLKLSLEWESILSSKKLKS